MQKKQFTDRVNKLEVFKLYVDDILVHGVRWGYCQAEVRLMLLRCAVS